MANMYRSFFPRGLKDIAGEAFVVHTTGSGRSLRVSKPLFDDSLSYTEMQGLHQATLREAGTYASFANGQDVYRRAARATGATAYYLALADWFGAPRVLEINVDNWTGQTGQTIRVKARDNVMVARVLVLIRDAAGNVLEAGAAVQSQAGSAWWSYTTRSPVSMTPFPSVEAIAIDSSGNRDSFVIS